jgi:hypothetical protein
MGIRPVGAELSDADGRTDITKLIVAFHNFAKAPKTCSIEAVFFPLRVLEEFNKKHKYGPR